MIKRQGLTKKKTNSVAQNLVLKVVLLLLLLLNTWNLLCLKKYLKTTGNGFSQILAHAEPRNHSSSWNSRSLQTCMNLDHADEQVFYHSDEEMLQHFLELDKISIKWRALLNISASAHRRSIEDYWIMQPYEKFINEFPWKVHFGPFIPIFIPWKILYGRPKTVIDAFVQEHNMTFCDTLLQLFNSFRPKEFIYTTVIQHDQGLLAFSDWCGSRSTFQKIWTHQILQFSAGGYGHVPIPLIAPIQKSKQQLMEERKDRTAQKICDTANQSLLGNSGRLWDIRPALNTGFEQFIKNSKRGNINEVDGRPLYSRYRGRYWEFFGWGCNKFMITPRGRGATTFSLYETLELRGAIPIYVWSKVKWLPYQHLEKNYVLSVEFEDPVNSTVAKIIRLANSILHENGEKNYTHMLSWIRNNYERYFTFEATLQQILLFLRNGPGPGNSGSSLHCW